MVTPARNEHGHFIKGLSDEPKPDSATSASNAGSPASEDAGGSRGAIDPATIDARIAGNAAESETGGAKRGRGRPPGKGAKKQKEDSPVHIAGGRIDLDSLNFTLFYAHALLAKASKTPELELSEDEAKTLATSCSNVMKHYNLKTSQKAIDWGNLVLTGCIMYGGKFYAISERHKMEKAAKHAERSNVTDAFNIPQNAG